MSASASFVRLFQQFVKACPELNLYPFQLLHLDMLYASFNLHKAFPCNRNPFQIQHADKLCLPYPSLEPDFPDVLPYVSALILFYLLFQSPHLCLCTISGPLFLLFYPKTRIKWDSYGSFFCKRLLEDINFSRFFPRKIKSIRNPPPSATPTMSERAPTQRLNETDALSHLPFLNREIIYQEHQHQRNLARRHCHLRKPIYEYGAEERHQNNALQVFPHDKPDETGDAPD